MSKDGALADRRNEASSTAEAAVQPAQPAAPEQLQQIALLNLQRMLEEDGDKDKPKPKPKPKPKDGWSYSSDLGLANDNLPLVGLVPQNRRDPYEPSKYADDDGRTMGLAFEQSFTNEQRGLQVSTFSQYEMITQDGAMEDPTRNRRADLLNNIVQLNKRYELGGGVTFFAGLGAGAQTVGNLNGVGLQNWFHHNGGFGGRFLGQGLQDNYGGMTGSVTSPALSGGVGVRASTGDEDGWHANLGASVTGLAGLGNRGMSSMQAGITAQGGNNRIAQVEAGVFASAGHANGSYLAFAPLEHPSIGYEVKVQMDVLHRIGVPVSPYVMVQSNGAGFGDTTFTIGFVIGGSHSAWLRPPR
jgi:hypothetical protein